MDVESTHYFLSICCSFTLAKGSFCLFQSLAYPERRLIQCESAMVKVQINFVITKSFPKINGSAMVAKQSFHMNNSVKLNKIFTQSFLSVAVVFEGC